MVVKKKKTYKKQKGGLELPEIPEKLTGYFNFIIFQINQHINHIQEANQKLQYNRIEMIITEIKLTCSDNDNGDNIYILKLSIKLLEILLKYSKGISYKRTMESFVKEILYDIFNIPINNFVNKLIKIFINMLFNQYLLTQPDIARHNIILSLSTFHLEFRDNQYLMNLIKDIFLNEYKVWYGVPVFYGNTLDSYHNNQKRELGYNQFICEKVGVSSKDKRNYIINPVGALAYEYINESNYLGTPLYDLLSKILRFDYVQGNKRQGSFTQLPKLEHLRQTTTKFCIAIVMFNNEEVYQEPTNDVSMCSKFYGCSLKMKAVIRKENIASDEHILELLSILLKKELDNPVPVNISHFEQFNRRRNGSVLSPIQEFDRRPQINNNQINSSALRTTQTFMQDRDLNNEENPINVHEVVHPQIPKDQINLNKNIIEYNRRYYDNYFEKLGKEAYKLINNTKNNKDDIPKIKKLLSIIDKILNIRYHHSMTEYSKIHIPPIIYELDRQLKLRLSYLEKNKKNKINKFYNISTSNLLQNENYLITLDKLYNEARRLTIKKEIEPRDIPKIKKLLELIKLIQKTDNRKMHIQHDIINDFFKKFFYPTLMPNLQRSNSKNRVPINIHIKNFSNRFYPQIKYNTKPSMLINADD